LGADWLDRFELIILVEEIAGVEIADHEADRIEVVGDLILYADDRRSVIRSARRVTAPGALPGHAKRTWQTLQCKDMEKYRGDILWLTLRRRVESHAFGRSLVQSGAPCYLLGDHERHLYRSHCDPANEYMHAQFERPGRPRAILCPRLWVVRAMTPDLDLWAL
jgi:hypothetical protein